MEYVSPIGLAVNFAYARAWEIREFVWVFMPLKIKIPDEIEKTIRRSTATKRANLIRSDFKINLGKSRINLSLAEKEV
jgi:hypothetical protein